MNRRHWCLSACALACGGASAVASPAFPTHAVRLVVAFPAGGAADAAARIVAEKLAAAWKQPVIVDNRPGAAGVVGTEVVLKSPPDGHTALLNVSTLLVNEVTKPPASFRLFRDLQPVTTLFTTPVLFAVGEGVKGSTLSDVMREAGAAGKPFSYGHHGDGTSTHLMGERLNRLSGARMVAVPYAGDAPMSNDLMGGHLSAGFSSTTTARKLVDSGKVRVVAQSFQRRSPLFPGVPTFAELGYAEMDRGTWGRIFLPAGAPQAVASQFSSAVRAALQQRDVREKFDALGLVPGGGTPAQTLTDLQGDYAYWQSRQREAGR